MGHTEHIIIFTTLVIVSWFALLFLLRGVVGWVYHHLISPLKH